MSLPVTELTMDPPEADQEPSDNPLEEAEANIAENEDGEDDSVSEGGHPSISPSNTSRTKSEESDDIEDSRKITYRDFSHIKPPEGEFSIPRHPPNKEATFPMKLHVIISSPEFWEISWLPHGRSWRIKNQKSFEERVIPIFFRHGRYASFARQVNGWGYRRITRGSETNSYYHEVSVFQCVAVTRDSVHRSHVKLTGR
jgi:hypothetical protein